MTYLHDISSMAIAFVRCSIYDIPSRYQQYRHCVCNSVCNSLFQGEQHRQYGRIFREKVGPATHVHISCPNLIEQVFRSQGKHPIRMPFNSWGEYRKVSGQSCGILTRYFSQLYEIDLTFSDIFH